ARGIRFEGRARSSDRCGMSELGLRATGAAMASPSPFDFFDVKSLLSEEERQIQSTVGRWVDERVEPIIADAFDAHRFPAELIPEIAEMGLLGCTIEGYECAGLNNVS